jgi:hypothetical protein
LNALRGSPRNSAEAKITRIKEALVEGKAILKGRILSTCSQQKKLIT